MNKITLYNTMSRSKEQFEPFSDANVTLYTCGPTVYDYLQIGNWTAFIRWDILVRTLQANGYGTNWIMNITDVGHLVSDADDGEDKLEKGAKREGKTAWEVAEYYTKDFLQGLEALNISVPRDHLPKATDHIAEQIDIVKKLEEKGYTYIIDDGVYYDTSKFKDYGKLARLKIEDLKAGARVEFNPQKKNPTDFALWKFTPEGEKRDMEWESPWGKGFPGWHLECSAMAMKYLGETLDIHAGGIDHIPVHHTNEIAQSEGVTGKPFANIWLHSNFLTVDGTKLSKSLNNSYTLKDIYDKGFDALDFRMFVLQGHYRTEVNFTWEGLESARNRRRHWQAVVSLRHQLNERTDHEDPDDFITLKEAIIGAPDAIKIALSENLNSPAALRIVDDMITRIESSGVESLKQAELEQFIAFLDEIFGLRLLETTPDITKEQKELVAKREEARKQSKWQESDEIRGALKEQGIEVRDTESGSVWSRA
jgi:cysteinyl-tRNA synthetase